MAGEDLQTYGDLGLRGEVGSVGVGLHSGAARFESAPLRHPRKDVVMLCAGRM